MADQPGDPTARRHGRPAGAARSITVEELAGEVRRQPLRLVEALGPSFFADAHLPGAVNLPPDLVDSWASILLPDVGAPIVVYGARSSGAAASTAARLIDRGYTNVAVLPDGKEGWVEAGLAVVREGSG